MFPRRNQRASGNAHPTPRKHRADYQILLYMGILVIIGLIVIYSISPARVEMMNAGGNSTLAQTHFMERQFLYLGVGLTTFFVAASLPLNLWRKYPKHVLLLGLLSCALLSFLGLLMDGGLIIKTNGAVRWYDFGIISFQPSELLKFGILLFGATFLGKQVAQKKVNDLHETLIPIGLIVVVSVLLVVVMQKDMGTGLTIFGMVFAMLYAAGLSRKWLALGVGISLVSGVLMVLFSPHRITRVLTFFSSSGVSDAASYHINQATIALGSGGFFGKGLGHGVQAFGYLPEAVNDSIFAIVGETFGFLGSTVVIVLFAALLWRILKVMETTVAPEWRILTAGVFGLIATHVAVNVGAMTGVFPLTGVTLPFLSFGGTSLLFTMLELGIVMAISRYTTHMNITKQEAVRETTVRRRGVGRSRYASPRRNK
ncbi:hypothetical protein EOM57_03270 [Candidatus Saccharibacteria bacterium]|nr:hypothetical protein [Candidatus Saccharibacteria bacterium]